MNNESVSIRQNVDSLCSDATAISL